VRILTDPRITTWPCPCAALASEHGATWITKDRAFARFPGPRWPHPLQN